MFYVYVGESVRLMDNVLITGSALRLANVNRINRINRTAVTVAGIEGVASRMIESR